jgi:hypothetical protein
VFPNKVNFPSTESRDILVSEVSSAYLGDFSGNRSVLFPSALDTIEEEDSSRVIQN